MASHAENLEHLPLGTSCGTGDHTPEPHALWGHTVFLASPRDVKGFYTKEKENSCTKVPASHASSHRRARGRLPAVPSLLSPARGASRASPSESTAQPVLVSGAPRQGKASGLQGHLQQACSLLPTTPPLGLKVTGHSQPCRRPVPHCWHKLLPGLWAHSWLQGRIWSSWDPPPPAQGPLSQQVASADLSSPPSREPEHRARQRICRRPPAFCPAFGPLCDIHHAHARLLGIRTSLGTLTVVLATGSNTHTLWTSTGPQTLISKG